MSEGKKYDKGKNQLASILGGFSNALWSVGEVGTFGANKYGLNNWKEVEDAKRRYADAMFRHFFTYLNGEEIDKESGLPHLAHVAWNSLSILEFYLTETKEVYKYNEY